MEFQLGIFENKRPFCEASVLNTTTLMNCIVKSHLTYLVLTKWLTSWYTKNSLQILQPVTALKHKNLRVVSSVLDQNYLVD